MNKLFLLFLSEWDLYSDTICLFPAFPVRMRPVFGQDFTFSSFLCPNGTCIRTEFYFFKLSVSEWDLYSDRILLFPAFCVRMGPVFGHDLPFSSFLCPNGTCIRTRFAFFQLSCPNETRIRTRFAFFQLFLSE
jgi:hypothetical protein